MPSAWSVQYFSNGQWFPVKAHGTYGTAMVSFNTVRFEQVETTAIRVALQIQSGWCAGILEMRAYEPDLLTPAQTWLAQDGISTGTNLLSDQDGDGISLLTAYALGLDPDGNATDAMPSPALSGGNLGMTFWGARTDVNYAAESSTDLIDWTPEGVTLSAPDSSGHRDAAVPHDGPSRFMRLLFSEKEPAVE